MRVVEREKEYVVAELDGEFYGFLHGDGYYTCNGFGPIEGAKKGDPEFCKSPLGFINENTRDRENYEKLSRAKLVYVTQKTIYLIGEDVPEEEL